MFLPGALRWLWRDYHNQTAGAFTNDTEPESPPCCEGNLLYFA